MRFPLKKLPGWFGGIILVLLSILALGIVGWRGLHSQRAVVWEEARQDCERWIEGLSIEELIAQPEEVAIYTSSPEPGTVVFQKEASVAQLQQWQNEGGRTQGGLPVRALAGLELLRRDPQYSHALRLRKQVLGEEISLITPKVMQELAVIAQEEGWEGDWGSWRASWEHDERVRYALRLSESSGWVIAEDELYYRWGQEAGEQRLRYSSPETIAAALAQQLEGRSSRTSWVGGSVSFGEARVGRELQRVLASRQLGAARVDFGVIDDAELEKAWAGQRRWGLTMLGLALSAVTLGMWVMVRGMLKEKRMAHAKSQFVASVTHELRAPVGSMRLMADALDQKRVSKEQAEEFHHLMSRESSRLSVLIENVMDLARVEDGQRAIRIEEIELASLIQEVCEMMTLQAKEKQVTLKPKGNELLVNADAMALRQILVNLIDNAIKFSPAGSSVTIDWGSDWWFSVADEGPGIPPNVRDRIFERFYRGEDELRRQTKGVGIGLSLVKELVDLHGGEIRVESGASKGSVFRITFHEK